MEQPALRRHLGRGRRLHRAPPGEGPLIRLAPLLALALASPAFAEEPPDPAAPPDSWDFGDTPVAPPPPPSPWSLTGFLRSDAALWTERLSDQPLAKLRQSLDLALSYKEGPLRLVASAHSEYDLAYLEIFGDRDRFDGPTLDAYEALVDVRKTFAALELDAFDLAFGWQIANWGEGDAVSLADLTNPRDLREPGLSDLDDLRLPLLMTRLGYFAGAHRVELLVTHESPRGYRSPPFGPFSPLPALVSSSDLDLAALLADKDVAYAHEGPRFAPAAGLFLRWSYKGPGLDLAAFFASAQDSLGVVRLPPPESLGNRDIPLPLEHPRFHALGLTGARPVADWLLKWELVLSLDKPTNTLTPGPLLPELGAADVSSLGGMLGVQYSGLPDTTVTLEMAQTLPFSHPATLFPLDVPNIALRVSHLALREDLRLDLALSLQGWRAELGWVARAEATYQLMDGLRLGLGYITYQPSERPGPLSGLTTHDRLFAKLRWDFTLL